MRFLLIFQIIIFQYLFGVFCFWFIFGVFSEFLDLLGLYFHIVKNFIFNFLAGATKFFKISGKIIFFSGKNSDLALRTNGEPEKEKDLINRFSNLTF